MLSAGGSTHLHTKTHRTTQITTNVEDCGSCPVFASFTLAFALQLRKKHGKTSVRVRKNLSQVKKKPQSVYSTRITRTPTHYKTHTNTHITKPTHKHTHTLQNNIKPPQYKLKQTQCKIYPNEIVTI